MDVRIGNGMTANFFLKIRQAGIGFYVSSWLCGENQEALDILKILVEESSAPYEINK